MVLWGGGGSEGKAKPHAVWGDSVWRESEAAEQSGSMAGYKRGVKTAIYTSRLPYKVKA